MTPFAPGHPHLTQNQDSALTTDAPWLDQIPLFRKEIVRDTG
jgi:hypothetical protein